MTLEQDLQNAIKQAILSYVATIVPEVDSPTIFCEKINEVKSYPCIVIKTEAPIPLGYQSEIFELNAVISSYSHLSDDRDRANFALNADYIFKAIQSTLDYSSYITDENLSINSVTFNSAVTSEISEKIISQEIEITINGCWTAGG